MRVSALGAMAKEDAPQKAENLIAPPSEYIMCPGNKARPRARIDG